VTRKRWPDGVESTPFFEKNLPGHAPEWVGRVQLELRCGLEEATPLGEQQVAEQSRCLLGG